MENDFFLKEGIDFSDHGSYKHKVKLISDYYDLVEKYVTF